VPSFIWAILLSGSAGATQSSLDSFLSCASCRSGAARRRKHPPGPPLRQLAEIGLVIVATVAAAQRLQRGVGFQRRGIDADALPSSRPLASAKSRTQAKTFSTTTSGRRWRMVVKLEWSGWPRSQIAEELLERAAVGAAPGDAALGIQALEVADEEHAEVGAGGILGRPKWAS